MKKITFVLLLFVFASCTRASIVQSGKNTIRQIAPNAVFGDTTNITINAPKSKIDRLLGKSQPYFAERGKVSVSWERTGINRDSIKIEILYDNQTTKPKK
jgi:hypothetical protein